jgi:hypothetical protein
MRNEMKILAQREKENLNQQKKNHSKTKGMLYT